MFHVETFSVSNERKYEDYSIVFFLPEYLLIFKTFFKGNVSQVQNVSGTFRKTLVSKSTAPC